MYKNNPSQPIILSGPQYLHGQLGLEEATAVRYHKEKAQSDQRQLRAMQSFSEGQGKFHSGGKVAQNRYLVGPIDDKDAKASIAYFAILAAREVPLNQRQKLIELSDNYYNMALFTKEGNWFFDYRKDILVNGIKKIQENLKEIPSYNGKSQALVLAAETAKDTNLNYNDSEKFFLDRLIEAGQGMLEDTGEMIEGAKRAVSAAAGALIPGCKPKETKEDCEKRLQREKYIKYGLLGLAGTSAVLFFGMPYLGAAKQFFGGLFGGDDE